MLKRPRAPSPIPSIMPDDLLLPSDPSPIDFSQHAMKRRRMAPPSLDGSTRGWNVVPGSQDVDDGEETWEFNDDVGLRHASASMFPTQGSGEYAKFNSLLHDLHAEHQFRRMMSPSSGSAIPFVAQEHRGQPSLNHAPPYPQFNPSIAQPSPTRQSRPAYGQMIPVPYSPPSPEPDVHHQDENLSLLKGLYVGTRAAYTGTVDDPHPDEGQKVKENYEGANKLIRTLFLSRRQILTKPDSTDFP